MKNSRSQEVLADGKPYFHCSITILSTELTVFLGYESKELLAVLCKWFDCEDRFLYDTHSRDEEEIHNVWANLIGATTPDQLQASLPEGAVGSGFTSRVVFIFEEDKDKIVIKPDLTPGQIRLRADLIADLGEIRNITGQFETTPGFDAVYAKWRHTSESKLSFTEPRLDYYIQRRPTHLFKLSIIYSASRASDRIIDTQDILAAIEVLEEAEKKMPRVFEGVGSNPLASAQLRILRMIKKSTRVPMADIAREVSNDLTNTQLSEVMSSLVQQQLISIDVVQGIAIYKGGK